MPLIETSVYLPRDEYDAVEQNFEDSDFDSLSKYLRSQIQECDPNND